MKKLFSLVSAVLFLVGCNNINDDVLANEYNNDVEENIEFENNVDEIEFENINIEEYELTEQEEMLDKVLELIDDGKAFDVGDYEAGDIPKGEYAFVKFDGSGSYYSEEDKAGNILDNENFDSFGYVQVHEAGNIESRGALVSMEHIGELGVNGAKELYEVLNELENYDESGHYKVGVDIDPGEYSIESYGSGYIGLMSGPVGDSDIVSNDNFSGNYTVHVSEGQYLILSRAYFK